MPASLKKVVVAGVGALGSHSVLFLRNVAQMRVYDFDRVEQKNVLAQFHAKQSVGKAKAVGLPQTMQFLFGAKVEGTVARLSDANAAVLSAGYDLILDCLDNAKSRRLVSAEARRSRTPCLHGAITADGTYGRVIWDEDFVADEEGTEGGATCEDGEHLPFITLVSSQLAVAAQEFFRTGKKMSFNIFRGSGTKRL